MDATVQVRDRGVLTLPADLREKYGIRPGDTFHLVDLDGVFVLTPMVPVVPELARETERNLDEKLPAALSAFQAIVSRCLRVVSDPQPADLTAHVGLADPKDLPI